MAHSASEAKRPAPSRGDPPAPNPDPGHVHPTHGRPARGLIYVLKALGLWAGFSAVLSGMSVCPFCGQQACPTGIGIYALLGALLSFFMLRGRTWARRLWLRLTARHDS
ncbi:hypothetical protein JXB37_06450 [candidate division WOR-3 bacterium]|nr:hypothetical protein [candidate division WOR-3 bacterium]